MSQERKSEETINLAAQLRGRVNPDTFRRFSRRGAEGTLVDWAAYGRPTKSVFIYSCRFSDAPTDYFLKRSGSGDSAARTHARAAALRLAPDGSLALDQSVHDG